MNNYDKILEIANKNKGYITTSEVVDNCIERRFLTELVDKGNLVRLSRGYYGLPGYIPDDYYMVSSKSDKAIFSLATALYLHNLSDRTPLIYNITIPCGYSGALQKDNNVLLNYVNKNIWDLGLIEMKSPFGMKVRVYNCERTICDVIKYKKKIDGEIFSKALVEYVNSDKKDLNRLAMYAQEMNIQKKVSDYMEVLL